MHISSRAPLLSAAASMDCIWIMFVRSSFRRARQHFHHAEMLGLRNRTALGDAHQVALVALALLVVRVQLARTAQQLAVQAMLFLALDHDGDRLRTLGAAHAAVDGARALVGIVHHAAPFCFWPRIVAARAISRRTLANWWVCALWPCAFCMRKENCSRRSSAMWSISSCADFSRISLVSITAAPWSRIGFGSTAWPRLGGTPRAPRLRSRLRFRTASGRAGSARPSTRRCPCRRPCGLRSASW